MIVLEHAFITYPTMVSSLKLKFITVDLAWGGIKLVTKENPNNTHLRSEL